MCITPSAHAVLGPPQLHGVEPALLRPMMNSDTFLHVSAFLSTFSIRRSGMSHRSATNTYKLKETQCHQKATAMAAAYRTGDSLPFQSPPTALLRIESGP